MPVNDRIATTASPRPARNALPPPPPRRRSKITSIGSSNSPGPASSPPGSTGPLVNGDAVMSAAESAERFPCPVPSIDTPAGVQEVFERAARDEDAVMPLVRAIFDRDDGQTLLAAYGDAYGRARRALAESAGGRNLAGRGAPGRRGGALWGGRGRP